MDNPTEKKIIDSACKVFTSKGFYGTTMQNIADDAKVNKALLHYYYRNKEQLFNKTFEIIVKDFKQNVFSILKKDEDLFSKIENICKVILEYSYSHRMYLNFITTEMQQNEEMINKFKNILTIEYKQSLLYFYKQIKEAIEERVIENINPFELISIIFSLCLFNNHNQNFFQGLSINNSLIDDSSFQKKANLISNLIISGIKL